MPKPSTEVTLEITRGTCVVQVRGKRSNKGYKVLRSDAAKDDLMGHAKHRGDAIQLALDCCLEPGVINAKFTVRPDTN
jgi:hypothetical protein